MVDLAFEIEFGSVFTGVPLTVGAVDRALLMIFLGFFLSFILEVSHGFGAFDLDDIFSLVSTRLFGPFGIVPSTGLLTLGQLGRPRCAGH